MQKEWTCLYMSPKSLIHDLKSFIYGDCSLNKGGFFNFSNSFSQWLSVRLLEYMQKGFSHLKQLLVSWSTSQLNTFLASLHETVILFEIPHKHFCPIFLFFYPYSQRYFFKYYQWTPLSIPICKSRQVHATLSFFKPDWPVVKHISSESFWSCV